MPKLRKISKREIKKSLANYKRVFLKKNCNDHDYEFYFEYRLDLIVIGMKEKNGNFYIDRIVPSYEMLELFIYDLNPFGITIDELDFNQEETSGRLFSQDKWLYLYIKDLFTGYKLNLKNINLIGELG